VRLVDETLDLTRIARGMLELDESNVDFVALVEEAFDVIRPAASEKGVALSAQLSGTHATVHGDTTRLQQIVWNLLTNAVKFTPPGGRIEVRAKRAGAWVELSVRDTGVGIAAECLPFVFERFRQGTGAQLRTQPGLGLGLSIAKELVERHHGTITAQSAGEGQGGTFTVRFPLAAGG
jgi:signal transduction histidine kinase